jgi:hypothetical protein
MRGLTREGAQGAEGTVARPALVDHPVVRDVALVLAWFVAAAVIGALVWWKVTPLAEYTRTATNAEMGEDQLARQVSADAWFFVIGAVGGLVSGVALLLLRRRDPVVTVLLVAAGALLASWLMLRVGLWLGPANPKDVLRDVAVGHKVPLQLKTSTAGVYFSWPIGALLGSVAVLWGADDRRRLAVERPPEENHGWPGSGPGRLPAAPPSS